MAEKAEDLSLPASVVARIIKDAVSTYKKTVIAVCTCVETLLRQSITFVQVAKKKKFVFYSYVYN